MPRKARQPAERTRSMRPRTTRPVHLTIPGFGAVVGHAGRSMLYYPAWQNEHGATPIRETKAGGYRNTRVLYPLRAFAEDRQED